MSFPKYEHYKDSGVEWLGEVPAHWDVVPLKQVISKIESGTSVNAIDTPASGDELGVLKTSCVYRGEFDPSENKAIVVEEYDRAACPVTAGTLVVSRMNTPDLVGAAGVVKKTEENLFLPDRLWQVHFRDANPAFVHFWCNTNSYRAQVEMACAGASSSMQNLAQDQFRSFVLPKPALVEQDQITAFLTRETTKLDALITEQRTLIDLLKEKRQAVISHAVTKGLDPRVPMKDSGVEWLGKVPTHWSMTRLGRLADQINDINHEMPSATLGGIPFLSAKDLDDFGGLNFEDDIKTISEEDFDRLSRKICPRKGDIIYSRYGTIGRACVVRTDIRFLVSYSCCIIRVTKANVFLDFLRDLLSSDLILTESKARIRSMGQPDLGLDEIRRFPIPLPPIDEQVAIDRYLKAEVGALDALLSEAEKSVALLQERRSALISAAVTGKIDVRGAIGGV